jgi:hypothetical protein
VPLCYVGTVGRLDAVVTFICEEMAAAFKQQGLPVPPWRSRAAMLSKWAPQQLSALAAKIAGVRRAAPQAGEAVCSAGSGGPGAAGVAAHAQLCCGERPAAQTLAHAAAGSAPAGDGGPAPLAMPALIPAAAPAACGAPQYFLPAALAQPAPPLALPLPGAPQQAPPQPQAPQPPPPQLQWGVFSVAPAASAHPNGAAPAAAPLPPHGGVPALAPTAALGPAAHAHAHAAAPTGTPGGGLKFTRKASAEWKHDRRGANGKKATSLLAAALKKSGSRGNLSAAAAAAAAASVVAADEGISGGGARRQGAAAIRTTPNEAGWGHITTVRWGALHEAPSAAGAAAPQQQQPRLQQ